MGMGMGTDMTMITLRGITTDPGNKRPLRKCHRAIPL